MIQVDVVPILLELMVQWERLVLIQQLLIHQHVQTEPAAREERNAVLWETWTGGRLGAGGKGGVVISAGG